MRQFVMAPLVIFLVMVGWVMVQRMYLRFARRYPQWGPYRREDGGCSCGSARGDSCDASARRACERS